jgi:hypothetical protein
MLRSAGQPEFGSVENLRSKEKETEEAYRLMAKDAEHERESEEWCEALIGDAAE